MPKRNVFSQLSPGPLSSKHSKFEGMSNCTQCHSVGKGVPDAKCLACHKEIQQLRIQNKGYHAESLVKRKACIDCHSDHHGKNFKMIKFNEKKFNHNEAGYALEGAHKQVECKECHKPAFIQDKKIAIRKSTYLGLDEKCLSCHQDEHQGTLKQSCLDCHNMDKFKPATKFDHDQTKYKLKGAHRTVACIECHPMQNKNSKQYQQFKGVAFTSCTSCHKDEHDGKFGKNCTKCHNENSFKQIAQSFTTTFNHNTTKFPLEGRHSKVECKECHKGKSLTEPIQFNKCKNCHEDYHKGEFSNINTASDCKDCHALDEPFTQSTFDIARHETTTFKLKGAHVATACNSCHQKSKQWIFKNIGNQCIDCHTDNHQGQISEKYYPERNCRTCHNEEDWKKVQFDHRTTGYVLLGKHETVSCRSCHYATVADGTGQVYQTQRFKLLKNDCIECHENIHGKQFEKNSITNCKTCHSDYDSWKANLFNHNNTSFPLDGKHQNVSCSSCHKPTTDSNGRKIIIYKSNQLKCIDCHY